MVLVSVPGLWPELGLGSGAGHTPAIETGLELALKLELGLKMVLGSGLELGLKEKTC